MILMMSFSCEITCKSFVLFCELKNRVLYRLNIVFITQAFDKFYDH